MKGVYIMRYVANDGKVFDREEDCTAYEQRVDAQKTARKLSSQEAVNEIRKEEIKRLEKRALDAKANFVNDHRAFQSELVKYVKDTDDTEFGIKIIDDFIDKAYEKDTRDQASFLQIIAELLS